MSDTPIRQGSGRRRALAGITAIALTSIAVVGGAAAAGAATHKSTKGKLELCASSTTGHKVVFHVVRGSTELSKTVKTVAHRTTCASTLSLAKGSYRITETAASGEKVSSVRVSPTSRALSVKAAAAYAKAAVAKSHTTRAVFDNSVVHTTPTPPPPAPPTPTPPPTTPSDPGTGYLEVCKAAGDGYVAGSVSVSITDGLFSATQIVPVGQCTGPIQVPTGDATITEAVTSPYYLSGVTTMPASALVSTDTAGASAVVAVAASTDGSIETTATLVNKTNVGEVKICKALTANSGDLIANGDNAFSFDVAYQAPNSAPTDETRTVIVPQLGAPGSCVLTEPIPVGTKVSVTEDAAPNTTLQGITVQPAEDQVSVSGRTAVVTVDQDPDTHTSATFTNAADGTVEICKQIDDGNWQRGAQTLSRGRQEQDGSPYDGTPFHFSVNGGSPITVLAGACSPAISVPAGTATVSEIQDTPDFNLVGFTASGPDGSSRLLSGTNPITVAVPAGGVGNESLVIATNRVQTAQVKVCKELNDVPVGKTWDFTTSIDFGNDSYDYKYDTTLTPTGEGPSGEACGFLSSPLPVIDANGNPLQATVTEGTSPFGYSTTSGPIVEPTEIDYDGNGNAVSSKVFTAGDTSDDDGTYFLTANLGQGVNEFTFVNSLVVDP